MNDNDILGNANKDEVKMVLPYPPSANRYWRIFRNRAVPSKAATEYKAAAMRIASQSGLEAPTSDYFHSVDLVLHPKKKKDGSASKTIIDLDNCLKVALDALQGIAYSNDKQIREIRARYGEAMQDGGLTVTVKRLSVEDF